MTSSIRLAREDDAPALAAIYAPSVLHTSISFELVPPTADEMRARLLASHTHAPWLVAERAGEVLGFAYASRHRDRAAYQWSLDASVYIAEAHRGVGIARALYTTLFALAGRQGFYSVHAGVTLPNDASVRLHESLGFRPIGVYSSVGWKHGAWHDVGWWQLVLRDREGAPAPPRTVEEARLEPGWAEELARGSALLGALG